MNSINYVLVEVNVLIFSTYYFLPNYNSFAHLCRRRDWKLFFKPHNGKTTLAGSTSYNIILYFQVLHDFHKSTSKLTIEVLFELFSTIKPRSFSIASSCLPSHGRNVDILVAVVEYYTKLKKPRLGLASNWLKRLNVGDKVYGWIKKGSLQFPTDVVSFLNSFFTVFSQDGIVLVVIHYAIYGYVRISIFHTLLETLC